MKVGKINFLKCLEQIFFKYTILNSSHKNSVAALNKNDGCLYLTFRNNVY